MYAYVMKMTASCTFHRMREISVKVKESVNTAHVLFSPPFESAPKCSVTIEQISFLFFILRDLCQILNIRDSEYYINIRSHASSCSAGKVVQIMGCVGKATTMVNTISVQLNIVVVGSIVLTEFTGNNRITSTAPIPAEFDHHHECVV